MKINNLPGDFNALDISKPTAKKDFAILADLLRAASTQFPEYSEPDCEKVTFSASGYRVKCQPNADAVNRLADRINKGVPRLSAWSAPRLPCIKPYTERQRYNVAEGYRKQGEKLRTLSRSYAHSRAEYQAEAKAAECFSYQIATTGGIDADQLAA